MKPTVRWTIGPVNHHGFDSLELSIRNWKRIYKDEFNMVICHNGLNNSQFERVSRLNVEMIDQNKFKNSLPYLPKGPTWKLYPQRLNIKSHEIVIDNDLILFKRSPTIDKFLESDDLFICTSAYRRFYGQYRNIVPENMVINSGLFGMPPNYDLQNKIKEFIVKFPSEGWVDHCDDEGVLAYLMSNCNFMHIPMHEIAVCNPSVDFAPYRIGNSGVHFVGLNQGFSNYYFNYIFGLI